MCLFKVVSILLHSSLYLGIVVNTKEDSSHWLNLGKKDITNALGLELIEGTAKNVILFVGDGMGITTTTASRIYSKGESGFLSFEKFPHVGVLKTYNADKLVPDSASTATALFSGVKTNYKTSGVDSTVKLDDCEASLKPEAQIDSLIKWAQDSGKSTGFVTTTRVTHATPSALYAHVPNRNWECESTIPENSKKCKDIARQLIEDEPGKNINVIMGGGRQCLQSKVEEMPSDPIDTWACYRRDGRDLIQDWISDKKSRNKSYAVVQNNQELLKVGSETEFVLGIFANSHLSMNYTYEQSTADMPSLSKMTEKSIDILATTNSEGYMLVVEGGLIDYAHHRGHARQALDETAEFSNAINLAIEKTNPKETLIIVTSDHSHSLVFSGYPSRNISVLDIAENSIIDGIPYTSLLYGTGGPNNYQYSVNNGNAVRNDPSHNDTTHYEYSQQAVVLTDEVTHGGSDVLVYAKGPMAHLFHTVHEQTYVAYVISYAAKIGPLKSGSTNLFCSKVTFMLPLFCLVLLHQQN